MVIKLRSTWTTDPLFIKQGTNYYFYQNDHLGTPQKLTAINGAVVWQAKYSSFGEADVNGSSTITNNLRFPGQIYDDETGLHYNYHRYYDPETGRYLRVDPLRLSQLRLMKQFYLNDFLNAFPSNLNKNARRLLSVYFLHQYRIGSPQQLNTYSYAANNPFYFLDPDGRNPFGIIIGIAAGAYGGWVAGMQSGDMTTGIISGVVGGVAGGLVGVIFPNLSAVAGGIIGGSVGGFFGGITSVAIDDDPCDTFADYADAAVIGGIAGMVSGAVSGGIAAGAIYVGAPVIIGEAAGALVSAPVSMGLGLAQGALLN